MSANTHTHTKGVWEKECREVLWFPRLPKGDQAQFTQRKQIAGLITNSCTHLHKHTHGSRSQLIALISNILSSSLKAVSARLPDRRLSFNFTTEFVSMTGRLLAIRPLPAPVHAWTLREPLYFHKCIMFAAGGRFNQPFPFRFLRMLACVCPIYISPLSLQRKGFPVIKASMLFLQYATSKSSREGPGTVLLLPFRTSFNL